MSAGSRILIVSAHPLFGQGVGRLLCQDAGLSVVGIEGDVPTAQERIRELKPDIVILDTNDPQCDPTPILAQVLRAKQDVVLIGLNLSDNVACVCGIVHRMVGDVSDLLAIVRPAVPALQSERDEDCA